MKFDFGKYWKFETFIKQLILKRMQIKHNITPTGYPLMHFNNKLTKTASLMHIKH